MKLLEVTATYSRKVQPEQYHSLGSEISVRVQIEDGDDPELAIIGAREVARNHVMSELARTNEKLAEKIKDVYLGIPRAIREEMEI